VIGGAPAYTHGAGMIVIDWARLLRCTECGERDADFVLSGAMTGN